MKFYENEYPDIDDVTMCTVTDYDPVSGFRVTLDEYDKDGFLMLTELHNKKIRVPVASFLKVGTQLPLIVTDSGPSGTYLSKKGVKPDMAKVGRTRFALNRKLFSAAKQLPEPESWEKSFRELCGPDDDQSEHLWTMLQDRRFNELQPALSDAQIQVLQDKHAKLFGIKPCTQRMKFTIYSFAVNGNQLVKDTLSGASGAHTWTDQELYDNTDRYNIDILPIAVPTFQARITAYNKSCCENQFTKLQEDISSAGLDHCVFQEVE